MFNGIRRLANLMRGVQYTHVILGEDSVTYAHGYIPSDAVQLALREKQIVEQAQQTLWSAQAPQLPAEDDVVEALAWMQSPNPGEDTDAK